ncbi:MAG: HAMP domain-containing sensor histidine kinase [Planctomycetota bacterium]|nr:HAMP domain-containing sensor histidine kinase [Planctomycetota bacterium]
MLHAVGTAELASGELVLTPSAARLVDGVALPPRASGADELGGHLGSLAIDVAIHGGRSFRPELWTATAASLAGAFVVYLAALGALYAFLRRSEDLAERRTRFASAVTHELRTPLTTLCMYAEMLEAGLVKDPAQVAEYHATLKRESLRLAGLVDNVLTHAGLGERGSEAQPEPIEVASFLEGLGPRLRERCARGDLDGASPNDPAADLQLRTDELPPETHVLADRRGLERVLVNLVDNACKYGAAPIVIEATADASSLHLCISDAGPGIAKAHRRGLFDDYDRGAAEAWGDTASRTEGLGLGLSLARGLCRAMGGELELEHPGPAGALETSRKDPTRMSAPTTFQVRLPLA